MRLYGDGASVPSPLLYMEEIVKAVAKFITAAIAGLTVAGLAVADGTITTAEWLQIVAAVLGAYGVYLVPNVPAGDL